MQSKNLFDVMELLASEPAFVELSGKTVQGRRLIRKLYRDTFARFDSQITMTETARETRQNTCVQFGTYTEALRTRTNDKVVQIAGRFEFTYVLSQSGWRIERQAWRGL